MKAMLMDRVVSLREVSEPLRLVEIDPPQPAADEVLLRVTACGVCHTELDEIEGRTTPPNLPIVPGHEVVGRVEAVGSQVTERSRGDRLGVGWIHRSSGTIDENLDPSFIATGRDVNGGYAEYMTAPVDYTYPIPDVFTDVEAAPLLCAGAIGYRALKLSGLENGGRLGLTGFGGSAHLVLSLARHLFPQSEVFVFARDETTRQFALSLGADWAGDTSARAPLPCDAIIDTTPAWKPVIEALANLRPGGRLVVNAIRKEDSDRTELLRLSYHDHLWMERELKTVANITRFDISEFLTIAAAIPIRPRIETYPLHQANRALVDLKRLTVTGAKVLVM